LNSGAYCSKLMIGESMPETPSEEKRTFIRFPVELPVDYSDSYPDQPVKAKTNDISQEGICMVTDREFIVGEVLYLCIKLLDDAGEIYRKGKVIWCLRLAENRYRAGIRLDPYDIDADQIALKTLRAKITPSQ